jgi:hypothetical protein
MDAPLNEGFRRSDASIAGIGEIPPQDDLIHRDSGNIPLVAEPSEVVRGVQIDLDISINQSFRSLDAPIVGIDEILRRNVLAHGAPESMPLTADMPQYSQGWEYVMLPRVSFPGSFNRRGGADVDERCYSRIFGGLVSVVAGGVTTGSEEPMTSPEVMDGFVGGEKKPLSIVQRRLASQRAGTRRSNRHRGNKSR